MERDIYQKLLAWKRAKNRKPLLLQGARQVGKTFILKAFGEREYEKVFYVNFEKNPEIKFFFESALNPHEIIKKISIYLNQSYDPENTFIIFDEIQECPDALTSLKYFCEEAPEYTIAAAGSLLGVKLSEAKSFPVGKVYFLSMGPLSYFEFLEGIGKKNLREYLKEIIANKIMKIDEPLHLEFMALLGIYLYVGGMPEAVMAYKDFQDLEKVRELQENILKAYLFDFAKHAPKQQVNRITTVWDSIPLHLAKENKKFIFSAISKSARAREYEAALQWLLDAGLIYQSYNVSKPRVPLRHYIKKENFKIFLFDVGLLGAMCGLTPQAVLSTEKILTEFKGALMENFVAGEFAKAFGPDLFYWSNEGGSAAEVDFLLSKEDSVIPVEVKANISRKKKSLQVYYQKFKPPYLLRISGMNLEKNEIIYNYPLYLAAHILD